jgi:LmbE family N-acetylglucosaminyl deacetylase
MHWIYFSPHFDDAVLSCGGLIWEQSWGADSASIWTICAGTSTNETISTFTESLHARWETGAQAVAQRRQEDVAACAEVSAAYRHFPILDCIYRRGPVEGSFLYPSEEALFGPLHPSEQSLVSQVRGDLAATLGPGSGQQLVCPLALGGHVDHRLTRAAVEGLGRPVWYYADYPYATKNLLELEKLKRAGWQAIAFPVSIPGLYAWQAAVGRYRSQINTFWPNLSAMQEAIKDYCELSGGVTLWRPPSLA